MQKLKIGIIGLGSIAQSTYLPLLSNRRDIEIVGAYSPTQAKAIAVCEQYRIPYFSDKVQLIKAADALFVHSATASHFEIIRLILFHHKAVYVDKPLTETMTQSLLLTEYALKHRIPLMVGFNRRFAPAYQQVKSNRVQPSFVQLEKHRIDSIGRDFSFTLLDDYIHIIDTLLWLADEKLLPHSGFLNINLDNALVFATHQFKNKHQLYQAAMHRKAATSMELLTVIDENSTVSVKDLAVVTNIKNDIWSEKAVDSRESPFIKREFHGCVTHFIESVMGGTTPLCSGESALLAQGYIEKIIKAQSAAF